VPPQERHTDSLKSAEFSHALPGICLPPMILDPHLGELIQPV